MSDFEINSLVAKKYLGLFVDVSKSKGKLDSDAWLIDSEGVLRWTNYNPCHDPKHAWPIIVANGISIDFWGDFWGADIQMGCEIAFEHEDKNPLRAACICFLKLKDVERS